VELGLLVVALVAGFVDVGAAYVGGHVCGCVCVCVWFGVYVVELVVWVRK
jgi:hypothetical protein